MQGHLTNTSAGPTLRHFTSSVFVGGTHTVLCACHYRMSSRDNVGIVHNGCRSHRLGKCEVVAVSGYNMFRDEECKL